MTSDQIIKPEGGVLGEAQIETPNDAVGTSDAELEARLKRLEQLRSQYGPSVNKQPANITIQIKSTLDGLDDPYDPYNWAPWRKITIGIIFSFGQLVTLMTASMII